MKKQDARIVWEQLGESIADMQEEIDEINKMEKKGERVPEIAYGMKAMYMKEIDRMMAKRKRLERMF